MTDRITSVILLLLFVNGCSPVQVPPVHSEFFDVFETPVGNVDFPNSCNSNASGKVERGVALLHHMMYTEAEFLFDTALMEDGECAIALWGKSMAIIHPLWPGDPSEQDLIRGFELTRLANEQVNMSPRERAYIRTTYSYFDEERIGTKQRLLKFEAEWKRIVGLYPEDSEAKAFYALSMIATSNKGDLSFSKQQQAAELAKSVIEENPQHPGAHHYILHAYDFPGLAEKATTFANSYGEMTPKVPHAAHMLSHIYTRLGEWEKSIEWNTTSSASAWEMCVSSGVVNSHYTHALDYLAYAHLQMANDRAVEEILNDLASLKPPYNKTNHASAFAFSSIPARYAAERRDWSMAVNLSPRTPSDFPWNKSHDPYVAMTHFIKAVAYSRLGEPNKASEDLTQLIKLNEQTEATQPYWANQIQIQITIAQAWQLYKSGQEDHGLEMMKQAAVMESNTQKHPITPGAILPAYELYGDMLAESGLFPQAIEAYNLALQNNPKRLNSLLGVTNAYIALEDKNAVKASFEIIEQQVKGISIQRPDYDVIGQYLNGAG